MHLSNDELLVRQVCSVWGWNSLVPRPRGLGTRLGVTGVEVSRMFLVTVSQTRCDSYHLMIWFAHRQVDCIDVGCIVASFSGVLPRGLGTRLGALPLTLHNTSSLLISDFSRTSFRVHLLLGKRPGRLTALSAERLECQDHSIARAWYNRFVYTVQLITLLRLATRTERAHRKSHYFTTYYVPTNATFLIGQTWRFLAVKLRLAAVELLFDRDSRRTSCCKRRHSASKDNTGTAIL